MAITIKKLDQNELDHFKELILLFEDVFEMQGFQMPSDDHLQTQLLQDSFFVFAAFRDGEIAGGLTAYLLQQYYSSAPLVYIYDVAVKTSLQRTGIGKLLISCLIDYCRTVGVEEVFVQADAADGHAVDFYRSTGAVGELVFHFNYPLNKR